MANRVVLLGIASVFLSLAAAPSMAILRDVPAGQSALPPTSGAPLLKVDEVVEAFQKGGGGALSQYEGKPLRIVGQIKGFNADHALSHDGDLLMFLSPEESPSPVCVRFSSKQLQAFCLPEDKKPKITDERYVSFVRTRNLEHTIAYFNRDMNAIALFDSEMLTPPGQAATVPAVATPKPGVAADVFVRFTADRIPLVSIGDRFDADVEFEQIGGENIIVFKATAVPYVPPTTK